MKRSIFILITVTVVCLYAIAQTTKPSAANGKQLYAKYCLTCHQDDGSGVPRMNPPLIQTSYVTGDKTKLIQWVLKGSTENIEIDGKHYSNNMPPQNYLKDGEIADILTYIRSSFGNKASAITPAEVKAVRAVTK